MPSHREQSYGHPIISDDGASLNSPPDIPNQVLSAQRLEATAEPAERPTTGPKYAVHQVEGHPYNNSKAVVLNGQELDANVPDIATVDKCMNSRPNQSRMTTSRC